MVGSRTQPEQAVASRAWACTAAQALGSTAALVGGVYFALWLAGVPPRWSAQGTITMKTNMALAHVLAGAALVLLGARSTGPGRRAAAIVASALVAAIGALTLAEHVLRLDLGIDQLIASEPPGAPATAAPNRMGPPGAATLTLLGLGLLVLASRRRGSALIGALALCVVLTPAVGRLYGIGPLYGLPYVTGIAGPAVFGLLMLTVGLSIAPGDGPVPLLWRADPGGVLLRRMIAPAVLLPVVLGFIRLEGERRGLFGTSAGTGVFAVLLVSIFLLLLWRSATRLSAAAADRERAQEAQRESEQTVRAIFEEAAVGIVEVDEDDRFVAVNGRLCRMLGYRREELLGKTLHELTAPEDRSRTRDLNAKARAGELGVFDYEKRYLRRDGSRLWVHVTVSVVTDAEGRFVRAIGTVEDIDDRKRADEAMRKTEEALRESEGKFRSVFEQAAIGMGRASFTDARWIDVNDAFCRMLGYEREEMLRAPWPEMTHPEDVDLDLAPFRRMAAGELDWYTVEKRFIHKQGHHVWAKLTLSVVRDAQDRPQYEIAIIDDVTDRKVAEQALRDADRRKDEFLGVLSHELRNPLAPIRSSLYVLDRADPASDQASRARHVMSRQVTHLTRLIDDLLDVTRIARGKIQLRRAELDLGELARRAAEDHRSLMQAARLELEVLAPSEPVLVHADEARITQIIGNLLQNARKFTGEGGRVVLSVASEGDAATIRVRDTGTGIEPELLPRIFEPFTQAEQTLARSEGGLGLGLALVRGLAELHGGDVEVASSGRGGGTVFTVHLPLARSSGAGERPAHPPAPARRRYRVLVVDDNRDAAESLGDLVRLLGHEVEVAYDGPSALEKVGANRPEVVLCDIGLPGMDGYEVAKAVRAALAGAVRLVAVSGYAQPEDVKRAVEAGFDAHVPKPPDPARIEHLLA